MSSLQYAAAPSTANSNSNSNPNSQTPNPTQHSSLPSTPTKVSGEADSTVSQDESEEERASRLMEEHQRLYADKRDNLIDSIKETADVLTVMKKFNQENWIVHYPDLNRKAPSRSSSQSSLRRSYSTQPGARLADQAEPSSSSNSSTDHQISHPGLHRAVTSLADRSGSASAPNSPVRKSTKSDTANHNELSEEPSQIDTKEEEQEEEDSGELSVLRLDLKLGAATRNPHELVNTLEKSSVAQLLDGRMSQALRHLDSLNARISDTQSKVLVTGDLNAGKSTFVNALLRRDLMPTDQQPCTTVFCEVLDATELNNGKEEIHMLKEGIKYNVEDPETYVLYSLNDIETIVSEAEDVSPEDAPMLKCYCEDKRSTKESLLRNGVVDIALIDAPGLNRDSLKTTALFARQEEIDVVVFCLNAENHFTLSAKEFLWNASNDKAYIFIVVNKFEQIKNKEKCKRLVLEQIKQLSPRTYEDAKDLVHFVDSDAVLVGSSKSDGGSETPTDEKVQGEESSSPSDTAFSQLEAALRDFVLLKRSKSKLLPAQTYLLRLLFDITFLSRTNAAAAGAELDEARQALELARPALEKCKANHSKLEGLIEAEEDGVVSSVSVEALKAFNDAVDSIGKGEPAVSRVSLPEYPGLFEAFNYAGMVRAALLESIALATSDVEDAARISTTEAVERIRALGDKYLPEDANEGNKRVFLPDAMFSKRRNKGKGVAGLGLTLDLLEAKPSDIIDFAHQWSLVIGKDKKKYDAEGKEILDDEENELSLINRISLTAGALTLVGGKTLGVRSAVETLSSIMDLVGNKTARKWAGPVAAALSVGLVAYFIVDLPNSIPRNVGRSLRKDLLNGRASVSIENSSVLLLNSTSNQQDSTSSTPFSKENSDRISRETRKVLRLASWDLQERFRVAIAERRAQVEKNEQKEKKAGKAKDFFEDVTEKSHTIKEKLVAIDGMQC